MARFNYKGHDIYLRRSNSNDRTEYNVFVDGQQVGKLNDVAFHVDKQYLAHEPEPLSFKNFFSPTKETCRLPDGSELDLSLKMKLDKDAIGFTRCAITATVDGKTLSHEPLHDRSLGDLRRVSQNYEQMGRLTDEQFLALKSLTEPVILHTGRVNMPMYSEKFMPTAYVDELQTQQALNGEGSLKSNRYSDIRPGEHVFFDLRCNNPLVRRPSELYLNNKTSYVNRVEASVKEVYMSNTKDAVANIKRGTMFTKPFTIEGQISVYGKDGPHTVNGVFTNIDYRDEASRFRNEIYNMTPEQRTARMEAIRSLVEGVTLAEYATIRDFNDRGVEITEDLLVEIASRDGQWQMDRETVQNMTLEQDSPVMSIDELEQGFSLTAPIIDGEGNEWVQMSIEETQQEQDYFGTGSGDIEVEESQIGEAEPEGPEIGE